MKTVFAFLLSFFAIPLFCLSQDPAALDPDTFLTAGRKIPQVLLVGSWHFNYPGLDAHVTEEKDRINIYSDRRQKELEELLDYLALFKPTKIMVESGPVTGYLKWYYKEWKEGRGTLPAGEHFQIGMRLADRFQLDTIYGVDAIPLVVELSDNGSIRQIPYLDSILARHYFGGEDEASKRYEEFYDYQSAFFKENTLLESFLYLNADKVLNRFWGAYIEGGQFDSEGFEGADALSMFWFNRNLRIFRNIQQIGHDGDDRILVLFGAGHVGVLKWLFESSAEYKLVEFGGL
jgi:hypothetical protein